MQHAEAGSNIGEAVCAGVALTAWLLQQRGARHRTLGLFEALQGLRTGA